MRRSDSIGALSEALTNFQKSIPKITKNKTATVPTKNGGNYSYKYADLADIWDSIRGHLADNGLSVMQTPTTQSGEQALSTLISHSSGEWIEDTMKLMVVQESPQGQGSAITYARRYMLTSMLGIVADEDNDASDHRVASQIEKKRIWDAAKKALPDVNNPYDLTRFISEVIGKHPNRVLANEVDEAVEAIEMYKTE